MNEYDDDAIGGSDDDLNFDFDTSGIKSEENLALASGGLPPGKYHVRVDGIEKEHGNSPSMNVTFVVLASAVPGQVNRKLTEKLYLSDKAKPRLYLFASRLGLIQQADFGKPNVRKNWSEARGKQVIIEVAEREYDKRDGSKGKASNVTYGGIWKLGDPLVKDVPVAGGPTQPAPRNATTAAADEAFNDI